MSKYLEFTKAHNLSLLHDQLIAAGIQPERVESRDNEIRITVADDVLEANVQGIVNAHDSQAESPKALMRRKVRELALSCEGVALKDLTAAQIKALLAVVLYKAGAVDASLTVRPLDKWS